MFDDFTFGNSKAAVHMAQILARLDSPLRSNVTRFFHGSTSKFRRISNGFINTEDDDLRKEILWVYMKNRETYIDQKEWPPVIKTYIKNVLTYHLRKYIDDPKIYACRR